MKKCFVLYFFYVSIAIQKFCIALAAFASFMDCGLFQRSWQIFPEHVSVKSWKKKVEAGYLFIFFNGL